MNVRPPSTAVFALALCALAGCAVQEAPPPVVMQPMGEDRSPVLNLVAEKEAQLQQWKETAEQLRVSLEKTRAELTRTRAAARALGEKHETLQAEDTLLRQSLQTLDAERRDLLERLGEQQLAAVRRERAALEDALIRYEAFGSDPLAEPDEGAAEEELADEHEHEQPAPPTEPAGQAPAGGHHDASHH
ncbi:MAG: hypothetical protein KDD82_19445 [Planctomycetes bacterium]|nr:hypothetical protein [Planctomycetota bacterium]